MCYKEITCPKCCSRNIVKNGTTAQDKQRFRCKACRRQFIIDYTYLDCQIQHRQMIVPMTLNGSRIRDISRVLSISCGTVLSVIKVAASRIAEPFVPKRIENLELDEFWSFVEKKRSNAGRGIALTESVNR